MSTATADVSKRKAWLMAARPQTLPAGAAPVVVGTGLAVHADVFALFPALAALVGALLIQVGTNFANDYYDAIKGADTDEREGFTRVTAGGLIEPDAVKRAMILTYGLAVVVGVSLVAIGGLPIVVVGLSGIAAGILYTGGPFPYGYRGLGDLFVFLYFGLVAVTGTYYVQAVSRIPEVGTFPMTLPDGSLTVAAVVASLPAAGLSTAILVVNNVRDRETDMAAGKKTLAVYMGYRWSRVEFLALVGMAYVVPVVFALDPTYGLPALAPLFSLPLAAKTGKTVLTNTDGTALNPALERIGQTLFLHSLLFAAGLALPTLL
ncbi:1,4-dihydroxy-2-naphthoate polyprenyltransferase [Haloarcula pellucida]|uniref:1,4-dihydroxy-2-naphthoate octaprenyltransferase n=1 Tax=Haloarcula pellucida TaxID=1427151 RepID=A0A830GHS6_9EURY|nr:1,4-dihydroxy-2-naphthoate polyprenyltransferase [Halomicroarcula pellucida]MBX0347569.1 1,4-dihydroxy-2-naphthoate polyprenyltransferase [Halomicroarcula pellucida]GGN89347.1 1,4-dihydroxy-2-naphthoate polyprenyltransferase [Halomicroarcula pellucida]